MEMHWWCCECETTNSSPDDEHLVCSREGCEHHLCSDCYNPQQIGHNMHLNAQIVTTHSSISKSIINADEHRRGKNPKHVFKNARRVVGHHIKHSKIGKAFLKFWRYLGRKSGLKKDRLRIESRHMPTTVIKDDTEYLPSTSHVYEPEEVTEYVADVYYY